MSQPASARLSYADYLELERSTGIKHEFLDGTAVAMAGGTVAHAMLVTSVGAEVRAALRGRPCRVLGSEQKLIVEATGLASYPDAAIYCDGLRRHADDDHALCDPTVVFEVLSPSTESWDRGDKFDHYRRLPSLKGYVLVSSQRPWVEVCTVSGPHTWSVQAFGPGQRFALPGVGVELSVDALYEDALDQLPEPAPLRRA